MPKLFRLMPPAPAAPVAAEPGTSRRDLLVRGGLIGGAVGAAALMRPSGAAAQEQQTGAFEGADPNRFAWRIDGDDSQAIVFPNTGEGHADSGMAAGNHNFFGVTDPVVYFGYNYLGNGTPQIASEPQAAFVIEADENSANAAPNTTVEMYWEYTPPNGAFARHRPFFFRYVRTATTLQSALVAAVISAPTLQVQDGAGNKTFQIAAGSVEMHPKADADSVFDVRTNAGRSATIRAGGLTLVGYAGTRATTGTINAGNTTVLRLWGAVQGVQGAPGISVGSGDNGAAGLFAVASTASAAMRAVIARGKAGQKGNLVEVQDADSNVMSGFTENGYAFTRKTTAPPDAELTSGEVAMWFDPANGAPRAMFKGKQADGTVVFGSVPLAPNAPPPPPSGSPT
jgi:hypothetical protein